MDDPTIHCQAVRLLVKSGDPGNFQDALMIHSLLQKMVMISTRMLECIEGVRDRSLKVKHVIADAVKNDPINDERYEEIWRALSQLQLEIHKFSAQCTDLSTTMMDHWQNLMTLTRNNPLLADLNEPAVKGSLPMVMATSSLALTIAFIGLQTATAAIKIRENPRLYTSATLRELDYGTKMYMETKDLVENLGMLAPSLEKELLVMDQYLA